MGTPLNRAKASRLSGVACTPTERRVHGPDSRCCLDLVESASERRVLALNGGDGPGGGRGLGQVVLEVGLGQVQSGRSLGGLLAREWHLLGVLHQLRNSQSEQAERTPAVLAYLIVLRALIGYFPESGVGGGEVDFLLRLVELEGVHVVLRDVRDERHQALLVLQGQLLHVLDQGGAVLALLTAINRTLLSEVYIDSHLHSDAENDQNQLLHFVDAFI